MFSVQIQLNHILLLFDLIYAQLSVGLSSVSAQVSVCTGIKISDLILGIFTSRLPSVYILLSILFGKNHEIYMSVIFFGSRQAKIRVDPKI
jgi:hypothetical protein